MVRAAISLTTALALVLSGPASAMSQEVPLLMKEQAPVPAEKPMEAVAPAKDDKELLPMPPMRDPVPIMDPPPMMAPAPAPIKNSAFTITASEDGKTAHLVGQIAQGIVAELKTVIARNPNLETLILTSEGGVLIEGVGLAKLVEKHGLNTHVQFMCASACTFPMLAGKTRTLAPDAVAGFHQASFTSFFGPINERSRVDEVGNQLMRTIYADAGFPAEFIDRALTTAPADMWYPDHKALLSKGSMSRVVAADEFAVQSGDWKSLQDYLANFEGDPLWAAAKAEKPSYYGQALAVGWMVATLRSDSTAAVKTARDYLIRRILSDATAYPDALLDEFAQFETASWKASGISYNADCGPVLARSFPVSRPSFEREKREQAGVLLKMLKIPSPTKLPEGAAKQKIDASVLDFWGTMVADYYYTVYNVSENVCREPQNYYAALAQLPLDERATVLRGLILSSVMEMR